ncbi:hypothetical protein SUGI_0911790 [Cryptomeria japonica]|nr:hypothetical protein SUGI_0911790 [Cryptomeria japonica]
MSFDRSHASSSLLFPSLLLPSPPLDTLVHTLNDHPLHQSPLHVAHHPESIAPHSNSPVVSCLLHPIIIHANVHAALKPLIPHIPTQIIVLWPSQTIGHIEDEKTGYGSAPGGSDLTSPTPGLARLEIS